MRHRLPALVVPVLALLSCQPGPDPTQTVGPFTLLRDGVAVARVLDQATYDRLDTSFPYEDATTLAGDVIETFGDRFDWIVFVMNEGYGESGLPYVGQYSMVRNDVSGTGVGTFDNSAAYGSAGVLQGVVVLASRTCVGGGPILHELAHQWANYDAIPTTVYAHWGFSSVGGQLGGWDATTLEDLGGGDYRAKAPAHDYYGFGTIANGGNSLPYGALELYLMGLVPAEDVSDVKVAENPSWVDQANGVFHTDSLTTYTIAQIQSSLGGARSPDSTVSPKSFSMIVVMLSPAELSDQEWQDLDEDIDWFVLPQAGGVNGLYNYWEATSGRATITVPDLHP